MQIKQAFFYIKIPNHISIIYSQKKKIITFLGLLNNKSLKLNVQIFIIKSKNIIKISQFSFYNISNNRKKKLKLVQATLYALFQQFIFEISLWFHKKLKLCGVAYKIFDVNKFKKKLLLFKLGYSHCIYFKIPPKIKTFCLKTNQLFIYGNSYKNVTQAAALIKKYKIPDIYKGKGFLYKNQTIKLKEGKKV